MWQPIETCPNDGRPVLVTWADSKHVCSAVLGPGDIWVGLLPGGESRFIGPAIDLKDPPTHWMPKPPSPNELARMREAGFSVNDVRRAFNRPELRLD